MWYTAEQFLFDRSKQQNIASFITEPDIVEDNEEDIIEDTGEPSSSLNEEKYNLSELERAKLISCIETIRNVIGDTVPESKLREKIISSNFDADVALDAILKESSPKNAIGMFVADFATEIYNCKFILMQNILKYIYRFNGEQGTSGTTSRYVAQYYILYDFSIFYFNTV